MKSNELDSNQLINTYSNEHLDFTLCQIPIQSHNSDMITHVKRCLKSKQDGVSLKKHSIKKGVANKENKEPIESASSNNLNYLNLSRSLQQKCSFINKQKDEIAVLKKLVSDIKNNKQHELNEKKRLFQLQVNRLRQQEKECSQNLAQIQQLKSTLKEIKRKYDILTNEKNSMSQRNSDLARQNQELTVVITSLKIQLEQTINLSKKDDLEEENTQMHEEIRNLELQKEAIEGRCSNFQRKINEYILKYNELQESSNQRQIKYYKLQKDCDNLRVDKEQIEHKYQSISKQLHAEQQIHQEEVAKLKARLKRNQQKIEEQTQQNVVLKEAERRRYCNNEELEELNDCILRLKEQNVKLREQSKLQTNKWQKYIKKLTKEFSQSKQQLQQQYIQQQDNHRTILQMKQKQCQHLTEQLRRFSQKQSQCQLLFAQSNKQLEQFKRTVNLLEQQTNKNTNIEEKCCELIEQNQRITAHYGRLITEKNYIIEGINQRLQQYQHQMSNQDSILEKHRKENQLLSQQNIILNSQNDSLTETLERFKKLYEQAVQQKQQIQQIATTQQSTLSQLLIDSEKRQSNLKHQLEQLYEQIKRVRDQQGSQKRYYQQKYEKQLQEYNSLSKYLSEVNLENYNLLKNNTSNVLQIRNIKVELASTQANLNALQQQKNQESNITKQKMQYENKIIQLCSQIQILLQKLKQKENQILKINHQIADLHKLNHNLGMRCQQLIQDNRICNQSSIAESHIQYQNELKDVQITKFKQAEERYCKIIKEKDVIINKVKKQAEQQIRQVQEMAINLERIQQKYQTLSDQYSIESSQWEIQKQEIRKQWTQYHQFNQIEKKAIDNSRLSVSSYLDSSQVAVNILRKQNLELQRIFDCQIQRRNDIIRELIKQKKTLYEQLSDYRSSS